MGNTGVALGRDGASPFLNPATVVGINDRKIAFSVNFMALEVNRFDSFHQPGPVDPRFGDMALDQRSVSSARFTTIPSTICVFISRSALKGGKTPPEGDPTPWEGGHQKFAICLASLESQELLVPALSVHAPTSAGVTAQDVSLSRKWNRVQVGPSYSAEVNEKLALGASLQAAFTSYSFVQDAASITSATDGSAVQSSLGASGNGSSADLTAILGATYDLGGATVGASVQLPSLHMFGSYSATLHQTLDAMTSSQATVTSGSGTFRAKPPVRIAVGLGKTMPRFTVEADVSFDFGYAQGLASTMNINSTTATDGALASSAFSATYSARTLPTFNAAVGGEYFMTPRLSLLGGFWTNVSAFGPLAAGASALTRQSGAGPCSSSGALFGARFLPRWRRALARHTARIRLGPSARAEPVRRSERLERRTLQQLFGDLHSCGFDEPARAQGRDRRRQKSADAGGSRNPEDARRDQMSARPQQPLNFGARCQRSPRSQRVERANPVDMFLMVTRAVRSRPSLRRPMANALR